MELYQINTFHEIALSVFKIGSFIGMDIVAPEA
jgi:hypothetical protein